MRIRNKVKNRIQTEVKEPKEPKAPRPSGSFAREISLWALLARGSIYKILTVLMLMTAAEMVMFSRKLQVFAERDYDGDTYIAYFYRFEKVFNASEAPTLFFAAFCLISFVLVWSHLDTHGTKSSYTLKRLRVTGSHLFWVTTGYNFLCYLLLSAVQIGAALWMCRLYRERMPVELVSSQFEFLAFYRTGLLHELFPLADVAKWIRSLLLFFALSAMAADQSRMKPWRRFGMLGFYPCAGVWLIALEGIGFQMMDVVWYVVFAALSVVSVLRGIGIWGTDKSIREV